MTKIYEALQRAAKLRPILGKAKAKKIVPQPDYLRTRSFAVEEQMLGLYRSIIALLPNRRGWGRAVQFIASRREEGTSILSREFAKVCVRKLGASVLLLDADPEGPQLAYFDVMPDQGWQQAVLEEQPVKPAIKQVADSTLYVSQIAAPGESITQIVHAPAIEGIIEDLKRDYDLIVIDTPPAITSADGLALSHKVDGVILVVEAESTRWQIVRHTKEKIELRGGNVLGVLFNKRRHYIPKFIYDRL